MQYCLAGVAFVLCAATRVFATDVIDQALEANLAAQQRAEQSQQRLDTLSSEATTSAEEYRLLLRQHDELKAYNDQLETLVAGQKAQLDGYGRESIIAQRTRARSLPLLRDMLRTLEDFVKLDMPFLTTERKSRIDGLKALLDAPDAPLAEKYRRVIEAYRIEADYGRALEASSEELNLAGHARTVDVLRVGRVALLYLDFDQTSAGYFDLRARVWRALPSQFNQPIARGLKVARKQIPPELLALPVLTPERKP